ncbi:hypothetical protein HOLleu_04807 [Holothuria leucospilota]|uniref:Uncharacterized protein n=1 Tax=Holothuria leucospilota TaxID=206669 RepID=A0A9Q1CIR5_HOLLE|nr:hypothetical protein HOLleu_04807 [Holothuria leucospilota]
MTEIVSATFLPVLVVASILALSVYLDLYNSVYVELGFEHYAEKANSTLGGYKFPVWMKMPANTLVNVGYVGVGFLWLLRVTSSDKLHETDIATNLYMVSIFAWMAIIYGFTQFARIVTQSLFWAVLDQWFTLPFFCWTIIWSRTVQHGWKAQSAVLILVLSILSYNLALLHKFGFDVALGVHIAVAFWHGSSVVRRDQVANLENYLDEAGEFASVFSSESSWALVFGCGVWKPIVVYVCFEHHQGM